MVDGACEQRAQLPAGAVVDVGGDVSGSCGRRAVGQLKSLSSRPRHTEGWAVLAPSARWCPPGGLLVGWHFKGLSPWPQPLLRGGGGLWAPSSLPLRKLSVAPSYR